jgi:hypothetical protein
MKPIYQHHGVVHLLAISFVVALTFEGSVRGTDVVVVTSSVIPSSGVVEDRKKEKNNWIAGEQQCHESVPPRIDDGFDRLVEGQPQPEHQHQQVEHDNTATSSVWESGDMLDLSLALECTPNITYAYSHIHDEESWKIFYEAYHRAINETKPSVPREYRRDGFQVPVEIRFTPGVGRGVFATTPIKEGTVVWKPFNTAQFDTAVEFRRFLHHLPKKFACDILIWSYAVKAASTDSLDQNTTTTTTTTPTINSTNNGYNLCVEFDSGALFNTALNDAQQNLVELDGPAATSSEDTFICHGGGVSSSRDIAAGEGTAIPLWNILFLHT